MARKDTYHSAVRTALEKAFEELRKVEIFLDAWAFYQVHLLVFDDNKEIILLWKKH